MESTAPKASIQQSRRRVFFGWWIVSGAIGGQALNSGLYLQAIGLYFSEIRATFGWSRTVVNGVFALSRVESSLLAPIQGWLIEKFSARLIIQVGLVSLTSGMLLLSQVQAIWQYYLVFVLMSVGAGLAGPVTINAVLARWFIRHRSKAISFGLLGGPLGGAVLIPVIAWSLAAHGWRPTVFVSALIILVLAFPLTFLYRRSPEDHGLLPDGDTVVEGVSITEGGRVTLEGFTTRQALRTRAFWLIGLGHTMALFPVSAILVTLPGYLKDERGLGVAMVGAILVTVQVSQTISQVIGGILGDRYSKRVLSVFAMLINAVGLVILAAATTVPMVVAFALLHGIAMGIRMPLLQSWRADYFGRRSAPQILALGSLFASVGTTVSPLMASVIADLTGSYEWAYYAVAVIVALGAIFFIFANRPTLPEPSVPEHQPNPSPSPS